jgi:type IV pilus assembly PilX-like protein
VEVGEPWFPRPFSPVEEEGFPTMSKREETITEPSGQEGFALILAILALLLLTFLGLTLATSTDTELKIATNYRWSQQALYNAEAGIDAGKTILRDITDWSTVLPQVRVATTWTMTTTPGTAPSPPGGMPTNDRWGRPLRTFENASCDRRGGSVGFGAVMTDPGLAPTQGPFQYVTTIFNQQLKGAVTLWVRRGVISNEDGTIRDDPNNGLAILTAEGVAPFRGSRAGDTLSMPNMASRIIEVAITRTIAGVDPCEVYNAQTGASSSGAGYFGCSKILGGAGAAGGLASVFGDAARNATGSSGFGSGAAGGLVDTGVQ